METLFSILLPMFYVIAFLLCFRIMLWLMDRM